MKATLEHDDIVFMYAAKDPAVYAEYGATVVAWGGAHTQERVQRYADLNIHATGTMWCLTAGAETLHKNADLREATARDIEGKPIIIPWRIDDTYEGTPAWWGCTNHPTFRAHVRKKVCEAMSGGARGLHVDDHLGTAHPANSDGGCFCDYCMALFREYLQTHSSPELLAEAGVESFDAFDYRDVVRRYATTRERYLDVQHDIPLHQLYVDFQLQRAAENTRQLGTLAAEIVGRPITLSANTCLPNLVHTVVTPHLTYLVGEVAQHASEGTRRLLDAVRAYRMAEAIGKPIAATAMGWDWAYVKENGCEQLVCLWIALSYACGQRLMAPHRMWCFTPEKGTHWYDGPTETYAPLYRFVHKYPDLFRDCTTVGPLIPPTDIPVRFDTFAQREALQSALDAGDPHPLNAGENVWLFPRQRADGAVVVHVINLAYDSASDTIAPQDNVEITLDKVLVGRDVAEATVYAYDDEPQSVAVQSTAETVTLTLPQLRLWTTVLMK